MKNDTTWCFLKMNNCTTFRDTLHMADDVPTAVSVAFKIQLYGTIGSILIKSFDKNWGANRNAFQTKFASFRSLIVAVHLTEKRFEVWNEINFVS